METIGEERTVERDRLAALLAIDDTELTAIAPTDPRLLSLEPNVSLGSVGLKVDAQGEDERHELARHPDVIGTMMIAGDGSPSKRLSIPK